MKIWNCPSKNKAREYSIIETYRQYFYNQLPLEKEYWCTCGQSFNDQLIPGCELEQMVSSNLIQPEQFRGVDRDKEVIESNKQYLEAQWFCGDFIEQIKSNPFNPGIIDCDIVMIKNASIYLSRLLRYLTECDISDVLVVANIMLSNPYTGVSINGDKIIEELSSIESFKYSQSITNWKLHPVRFIYSGENFGKKTELGSFIFVSK